MSHGYSEIAKNEITHLTHSSSCCKRAFLAALIRSGGSLLISNNSIRISFGFSDGALLEKIERIVKEIAEGVTVSKEDGEAVLFGENIMPVLYALGVFRRSSKGETIVRSGVMPSLVKENCCAAAYIRGIFLGCGSVSLVGGYHLEFNFSHEDMANDVSAILRRFNIDSKIAVRTDRYVVYIKDNEAVSDCLALLGATQAVLALNDEYIKRQVRRDANRRNNCDLANIQKTVNASVRIVENVRLIEKTVGLGSLDEKLFVVAKARLEYPEDSFSFLADKLGLSKSTLKNRFNKLGEIADEIREKEKKD